MRIISVFNNKGGVGKTTLTFHLAHALGEIGKKVLIIDLDPQCNLTIFALDMGRIQKIWAPEDDFIDDFDAARKNIGKCSFEDLLTKERSVHFLLKPTEDGTAEMPGLPSVTALGTNVSLIPGRLTLHLYEAKVAERWNAVYQGDPLAIRTATRIRTLATEYSKLYGFDIVILDTSPSLGALNRHVLSLADGFIVPCLPDLFSIYGIRNIGAALNGWRKQFDSIFHFLSDAKRENFPRRFVQFLGYTIYNAKKYVNVNELGLAQAHYNYAKQIPHVVLSYISSESRLKIPDKLAEESIGGNSVIHSHNTLPSMAQKYHVPMWKLPGIPLEPEDRRSITGNSQTYLSTQGAYHAFAEDFLKRLDLLDD